jgi:hypothetical protein
MSDILSQQKPEIYGRFFNTIISSPTIKRVLRRRGRAMDWHYGFTMAVRYFDNSMTEMSKRTGIDMDRLNYLRNGAAKKIGLEEALVIQIETGGAVSWRQLIPNPDPRLHALRLESQSISALERSSPAGGQGQQDQKDKKSKKEEKPYSQKVFEAMTYEKQHCGHRQGQRTDLPLRENSHEVTGRTDIYLVETFDLGSEWQYRQGKKVMQQGVFELIQAMDDGLAVYLAAVLTEHSREEQHSLFREKTPEEIRVYALAMIKEKKTKRPKRSGVHWSDPHQEDSVL